LLQSGVQVRKKERNWDKWEAIGTWILAIFAIAAVIVAGFAFNNSQQALNLQNTTANYKVNIVPYFIEANLGINNITTNSTYVISNYGNLTLDLVVITPHALIINITNQPSPITFSYANYKAYIGSKFQILNQDSLESNIVFSGPEAENSPSPFINSTYFPTPPYFQQYEAFVQPGITPVNFTIPIYGSFNLNPQVFIQSGQTTGIFGFPTSLANFNIQVKITDMQTQKSFLENYNGTLDTWIWATPPFTSPSLFP